MSTAEARIEELRPSDLTPARTVGERIDVVVAFGSLATIDLLLKAAGFHRFHSVIRRCPTLGAENAAQSKIQRVCRAVDRAAAFYFKRAWCLQRSATATCLLRLYGVPARLVIGVRKFPFYAHAWVEVEGGVANDHPGVQRHYKVIETC